jgi:hypothetical protein
MAVKRAMVADCSSLGLLARTRLRVYGFIQLDYLYTH